MIGPDSELRNPAFAIVILAGGLLFGFGLAYSQMARPEIVLQFLQLIDLGLLFVMFGAAVVTGLGFLLIPQFRGTAPLTGESYTRRLKTFDRNVVTGGAIFGVGWGVSGVCPGSAYASVGIGNWPILIAIGGMFIGAYLQGRWRSHPDQSVDPTPND